MVEATEELHRGLGLTDLEYEMIVARLGRRPNDLELAMYAVMWSEHCSYKSSRRHLGRLPSAGERVLVGPGENAGVIDVGDGVAIALRIESHNHPSFVEPYQGAATGVGGILRDIFTMGARPIALMDPLFVGPLDDPHSAYLLDGIVRGIAGYGNAVGVPTVGGSVTFDPSYRTNPLVNVFCLGVMPKERLVFGRAKGVGNLAVLLGSRTGRDGIGGVSVLASAGFTEGAHAKRPSVQVGDPFEEKRLIEACLALLDEGLAVGIQDLGGAGITCATAETAARAGLGMDVVIDAIPRRQQAMSPVEVMTSESQERMLAIVEPQHLARVEELCATWEVEASVIGEVTAPGAGGVGSLRVVETGGGRVLAEVPAASLADEAPRYDRPRQQASPPVGHPGALDTAGRVDAALLGLLADPTFISSQYDHQLFLNTVLGPGEADAALLRLGGPGIPETERALALSCDANPGWCSLDPRLGTALTVAEAALNVSLVGATPIGLVNCLNFGNPEHETVMWQLTESIEGMRSACLALSVPVVGGNVSLYNESDGNDILPTPVVTVVGLLEQLVRRPPGIGWRDGDALVLLGPPSSNLAGSAYARRRGRSGGELSRLDLELHRQLCRFVASLVAGEAGLAEAPGLVGGAHDVSEGGLGVALAECALASGRGARINALRTAGELFSEAPSRVVLATASPAELIGRAASSGLGARVIGRVGGDRLVVEGLIDLGLDELWRAAHDAIAGALDSPRTGAETSPPADRPLQSG